MPILVARVDIFVASPSDLQEERQIVRRVIEELNRSELRDKYFLVPLLYEDEVPPEIGQEPQLIVDRYMKVQHSYIVLGMLWARMGTPFTITDTGEQFESGTQYELLKAYEAFQKDQKPHILLYRKEAPAPHADPVQKEKVDAFFEDFVTKQSRLDGLYAAYHNEQEFAKTIRDHLRKVLFRHPIEPSKATLVEAPEFEEEPRRLDAAMPAECMLGQPTELRAMICLPDSSGLRSLLPEATDSFSIDRQDIREGNLSIAFLKDPKTNKLQAATVTIEVDAPDFELKEASQALRLSAQNDSGMLTFRLIPRFARNQGLAIVRVKIRTLDGSEIVCGSTTLYSQIHGTKLQFAAQTVWRLVSLALSGASTVVRCSSDYDEDASEQLKQAVQAGDTAQSGQLVAKPPLANYPLEDARYRRLLETVEALLDTLRKGDRGRFAERFDAKVIRNQVGLFQQQHQQLMDWTKNEILGNRSYALGQYCGSKSIVSVNGSPLRTIRWKWPPQRVSERCILGIARRQPKQDQDPEQFDMLKLDFVTREIYESGGGCYVLHVSPTMRGAFVIVWAEVDLGLSKLYSDPVVLGRI